MVAYNKLVAKIATFKKEGEVEAEAYEKLKQRFTGALNGVVFDYMREKFYESELELIEGRRF